MIGDHDPSRRRCSEILDVMKFALRDAIIPLLTADLRLRDEIPIYPMLNQVPLNNYPTSVPFAGRLQEIVIDGFVDVVERGCLMLRL